MWSITLGISLGVLLLVYLASENKKRSKAKDELMTLFEKGTNLRGFEIDARRKSKGMLPEYGLAQIIALIEELIFEGKLDAEKRQDGSLTHVTYHLPKK